MIKMTKKKMQHQPIPLSLSSSLRISVGVHAGLLYPPPPCHALFDFLAPCTISSFFSFCVLSSNLAFVTLWKFASGGGGHGKS